ncbi:MAG: DUF547 domain-containing protein [Inquilinaceae bacterium]
MMLRRRTVLTAALTAATLRPLPAVAAPKAVLWPRWQAHDPSSVATVDHTVWDRLLRTYVRLPADGIARFAYGAVTPADRAALVAYVRRLGAVPVSSLNRGEQWALWTNLYNALTVGTVLDHYPVASIRDIDISPGLFANGPWGRSMIAVEGQALSLDDIEHRILRPIWQDPRIHYAVNCAALGCPNLAAEAFTSANAEPMLEAAARAFVNHPRGVTISDGRVRVSSIYHWFEEDFGGSDRGIVAHLMRYADPDLAAALRGRTMVRDLGYDWRLNDIDALARG